jgi:hypothetical protein
MDRSHNSITCKTPGKDHNTEATAHGSEAVSFKRLPRKSPSGEKSPKK